MSRRAVSQKDRFGGYTRQQCKFFRDVGALSTTEREAVSKVAASIDSDPKTLLQRWESHLKEASARYVRSREPNLDDDMKSLAFALLLSSRAPELTVVQTKSGEEKPSRTDKPQKRRDLSAQRAFLAEGYDQLTLGELSRVKAVAIAVQKDLDTGDLSIGDAFEEHLLEANARFKETKKTNLHDQRRSHAFIHLLRERDRGGRHANQKPSQVETRLPEKRSRERAPQVEKKVALLCEFVDQRFGDDEKVLAFRGARELLSASGVPDASHVVDVLAKVGDGGDALRHCAIVALAYEAPGVVDERPSDLEFTPSAGDVKVLLDRVSESHHQLEDRLLALTLSAARAELARKEARVVGSTKGLRRAERGLATALASIDSLKQRDMTALSSVAAAILDAG